MHKAMIRAIILISGLVCSHIALAGECSNLEAVNTPRPEYPKPDQVKDYLRGTQYTHVFVEGYVTVAFLVNENGSVTNIEIVESKNNPTRQIKNRSFNGFLETNVISTVSGWVFKSVSSVCSSSTTFYYELEKNA